ncbi:MAG: F-type H+-transporting ATPase subunit gamma [Planctomycetota bacterium]
MKGVKELKARLGSISGIKKVTSTMELVATAKMKKLQERALASRPYAESIKAMMAQVAAFAPADVSPLLRQPEEVTRECVIVVAADKGLCGAFNANILRVAVNYIADRQNDGVEIETYTFGKRATGTMEKLGFMSAGKCETKLELVSYMEIALAMRELGERFVNDDIQKVTLISTKFKSVVSFLPTVEAMLPLTEEESEETTKEDSGSADELDYIMEPSPETIMKRLIPKTLEIKLFSGVLESLASEFASRRVAMKNATDSASDMIDDLRREYNKARQSGITGELLEIIAGAEALNG